LAGTPNPPLTAMDWADTVIALSILAVLIQIAFHIYT
jgi:hypothetical protein